MGRPPSDMGAPPKVVAPRPARSLIAEAVRVPVAAATNRRSDPKCPRARARSAPAPSGVTM